MSTPSTLVCFGESLWDVLPAGRQPGGAPLHVAVHLHRLGQPVQLISCVGHDELGTELLALMAREGLDPRLVQRSQDHLTGVVKANVYPGQETTYNIVKPVAWDHIQHTAELQAAVAGARLLVYGSLAARNTNTRETLYRLLQHAPFKVFDANLRPGHYTREVVKYLLRQANLVRLSVPELAEIMAWLGQPAAEATALPYIAAHFGLQAVCVMKGAAGATVWADHRFFHLPVLSPAGPDRDWAFLATLLANWQTGQAPTDWLQQVSTAEHQTLFENPLC